MKTSAKESARKVTAVVVIDDTKICLDRTVEVLEKEGWQKVVPVHVTKDIRGQFNLFSGNLDAPMPKVCASDIARADLVVTDFDLGGGVNTWGLMLAMRHQFAKLPIVLLSGADVQTDSMPFNGIFFVDKGRTFNSSIYPKAGKRTLVERNWVRDGMVIFGERKDALPLIPADDPVWKGQEWEAKISAKDPRVHKRIDFPPLWSDLKVETPFETLLREAKKWEPSDRGSDRDHRLEELRAIVGLKDLKKTRVHYDGDRSFSIFEPGPLTHEIGHALCDGILSPEDVATFLPDLRLVLARIEEHVKKDDRFRACSDFILSKQPAENLPAIQGCY